MATDSAPSTMILEIITPEGRIYSSPCTLAELPTVTGELGIYPGHVPMMTELAAGEMRIHAWGKAIASFAVAGGFVHISPDAVRVLAFFASPGEAEQTIEEACLRAKEAIETAVDLPPEQLEMDILSLRAQLMRAKRK